VLSILRNTSNTVNNWSWEQDSSIMDQIDCGFVCLFVCLFNLLQDGGVRLPCPSTPNNGRRFEGISS